MKMNKDDKNYFESLFNERGMAKPTSKCLAVYNEKMNKFNIMVNNIKNDISNIKQSLEDGKETEVENMKQHKDILAALAGLDEKLDTKYAGKWVEKIFVVGLTTVGVTIIGAILSLIFIK